MAISNLVFLANSRNIITYCIPMSHVSSETTNRKLDLDVLCKKLNRIVDSEKQTDSLAVTARTIVQSLQTYKENPENPQFTYLGISKYIFDRFLFSRGFIAVNPPINAENFYLRNDAISRVYYRYLTHYDDFIFTVDYNLHPTFIVIYMHRTDPNGRNPKTASFIMTYFPEISSVPEIARADDDIVEHLLHELGRKFYPLWRSIIKDAVKSASTPGTPEEIPPINIIVLNEDNIMRPPAAPQF